MLEAGPASPADTGQAHSPLVHVGQVQGRWSHHDGGRCRVMTGVETGGTHPQGVGGDSGQRALGTECQEQRGHSAGQGSLSGTSQAL